MLKCGRSRRRLRYSENVEHLPAVIGPKACGLVTYPPGATFGPRQMRDFEFVWMIEGDAQYEVGRRNYSAPAGSMVLCRPGAVDGFVWDVAGRTRHAFAHFDITSVPPHWPGSSAWPYVRVLPDEDILRPMLRHILAWSEHGDRGHLSLSLAHLLSAYVTGNTTLRPIERPPRSAPVELALGFLYSRLSDRPDAPISLGELASEACVTPEHLCRLFAAEVGHSPSETVRLARLDGAANLIWRSNYSLAEIAALCGFTDGFHLSRRFKSAFGRSPSEVRRSIKAGSTPPLPRLLDQAR